MEFSTLANGILANIHTAVTVPKDGEQPKVLSRGEFLEQAERAWAQAAEKRTSEKLYNGGETRAKLTETEITALANKYDPRHMSDREYDAFLDDLESMGAISRWEKGLLGYNNMVVVAYPDENGEAVSRELEIVEAWSYSSAPPPIFKREDADGNILRWVSDRLRWSPEGKTPAQKEHQAAEVDLFRSLSAILSRMAGHSPEKTGVSEEKASDIIGQMRNPDSELYAGLLQKIKAQLERSEEEAEEQAIIDALDAILEGMRATDSRGRKKDMVSSMAGLSQQINALDESDPRRTQLEQLRQRLNQLGIYLDLNVGGKNEAGREESWESLTQFLIRQEKQKSSIDLADLI